MTENELRNKPVNVVKGWLGLNRANKTHKVIVDTYNACKPLPRGYRVSYTDDYCATTISAAAIKSGLTDIIPRECSCGKMVELFQKMGRWKENDAYVPKIGDVIFYDWDDSGKYDCTGWPDHVGYVAAVKGKTITVIEGNKGGKVAYRTVNINGRYIRGYGIPDYASRATKTTAKYYPKYSGKSDSIVDALKTVGETDTGITRRKKIATTNGIKDYTGTAAQNSKMLQLLKTGKLKK